MKVTRSGAGLPSWLDDALKLVGGTNVPPVESECGSAMTREADVNVKDLPTVAWKDETFYVKFENGNVAKLYNGFGNEVCELSHVTSMDDVHDQLTEDVIVASTEVDHAFEDELARVMGKTADAITVPQVESLTDAQGDDGQDEGQDDQDDQNMFGDPNAGIDVQGNVGFRRILAELGELKRAVKALSEQQYARTTVPNDAYDTGAAEREVTHFRQMADDTQKVIDAEHALDLTRQSERVKLNFEFLDKLFGDKLNEDERQVIIDQVEQQLIGVDQVDDVDSVDDVDQVDVDEQDDAPQEIDDLGEIADNLDDLVDDVEDIVDMTDDIEQIVDLLGDGSDDVELGDDVVLRCLGDEDAVNDVTAGVCPVCGEKLELLTGKGPISGRFCSGCGHEFGVNSATAKVYVKLMRTASAASEEDDSDGTDEE